jgi:hypothetical protein
MIKKIKDWTGIILVSAILIGGLLAPLFTPNYGVLMSGQNVYTPQPYL